jgi:hypothetical protein
MAAVAEQSPPARAATVADVDLEAEGRKLLQRCRKAAAAYGRPDLAGRVEQTIERLADDAFRVMIVGEFKHGKSSLLNAMMGELVSPVDADIATSVPIVVRVGTEPSGQAVVQIDGRTERQAFPLADLAHWATEGGNPDNQRHVQRVEVVLPHPILQAGVTFIDTPGVGGLASTHGTITAGALPMADAVLFVSDAAQELSANEVDFLRTVLRICPKVAYLLTKTDLHHHWRRIAELDAGHLERAGLPVTTFPLSSSLRDRATETDDQALADESGFRPLMRWLGREVATPGRRRAVDLVVAEVLDVSEQLRIPFAAERDMLTGADVEALLDELRRAKSDADQLKGSSGRWSSSMSDGFGDLSSDVDFDMRQRFRDLNRRIDERIDDMDPADAWPEFEPWLYREVGGAVTANYALLVERVQALVVRVSELFGAHASGAEFVADVAVAEEVLGGISADARLDLQQRRIVAQGMAMLRQGYSTVGMFSTYAGMAGIALTNPVSAVVALVMGRKGFKDERARQLGQRRAQAKAAARRYVDEVNFVISKDQRDTLRHLQRDLREYFAGRAEQAQRTAADAVAAATAAAKAGQDDHAARLANVDGELARIATLRDTADAIATVAAAGGGA